MDESDNDAGGLLAGARRVLKSVSDLAQARLELFLLELKEERIRFIQALLLAAVCVVCIVMTLVLVTFAIVVIFWEQRVIVVILLTALYAVGAGFAIRTLSRRLRNWQPFDCTIEQFKKDRACLEKRN